MLLRAFCPSPWSRLETTPFIFLSNFSAVNALNANFRKCLLRKQMNRKVGARIEKPTLLDNNKSQLNVHAPWTKYPNLSPKRQWVLRTCQKSYRPAGRHLPERCCRSMLAFLPDWYKRVTDQCWRLHQAPIGAVPADYNLYEPEKDFAQNPASLYNSCHCCAH